MTQIMKNILKFSIDEFVIENHDRTKTKLDPKGPPLGCKVHPFQVIELLMGDRYKLKSLDSNRTCLCL